jgi:hypothetical protein
MATVHDFVKFSFKGHIGFKRESYLSWRKRVSVYPSLKIEIGLIKAEKIGAPTENAGICSSRFAIDFIKHTSIAHILTNKIKFNILSNDEALGKSTTETATHVSSSRYSDIAFPAINGVPTLIKCPYCNSATISCIKWKVG